MTSFDELTDRLDLVDIIKANNSIKAAVKVVKEVNDLDRTRVSTKFCEATYIAEIDRDAFKLL